MTDKIPEEMKDQMLALLDNFHKRDWKKFDNTLDELKKSNKEMLEDE